MDGVTILNTITSNECGEIAEIMLLISVFAFLIFVLIGIIGYIGNDSDKPIVLCATFLIISLISMVIGIMILSNSAEITTYEVTISDEVSFKDFTSKYEIIEQRGEIYIVKERQTNNKENTNQ